VTEISYNNFQVGDEDSNYRLTTFAGGIWEPGTYIYVFAYISLNTRNANIDRHGKFDSNYNNSKETQGMKGLELGRE
jgi:hypothetical protein